MNPIEDQRQIIDQLYWIVKGSCPPDATSARCRFEYDHGHADGSISVSSALSYFYNGDFRYPSLDRDLRRPVMGIVQELHALMKAHTGGDWAAFTLFINEDGSVTTKFEYPDHKT